MTTFLGRTGWGDLHTIATCSWSEVYWARISIVYGAPLAIHWLFDGASKGQA